MEDIVAVGVELATGEQRYFLTYGRIQDTVDPKPVEELVLKFSTKCSLGGVPVRARVCQSLQEALSQPYFYECFFGLCQTKIPFGPRYEDWRKKTDALMKQGKEIWYLGSR